MPRLRPARRLVHSLPLALTLVAPLAAIACSSGSTGSFGKRDSGVPAFNPDSGLPPFDPDGGTVGSGTGATTGVTGASTGSSGTFVTGAGTSQTTTSQSASTTSMVIPSSGVLITVEPDGSGDAKPLLTAIENAKVAVHMEIYLLTNDTYINALEGLSKNIDVKVLLNQTFPSGSSAAETNASSYPTLQNAGVNVKWAPADPNRSEAGYTHEKAVIIDPGTDGEQVWIMTMNLDNSAVRYNREYLAQDTNSGDVAEAEQIFEADFAGSSPTVSGDLVVAPVNAEPALLSLIESATSTIDMEAEEIDESGIEGTIFHALTAKAQSGVTVHLVLEDSSESSQATAVTDLENAGGQVRGYLYGGSGLDIHAKAVVVDGARAYVGSENFTGGSLGYNRELGVIFSQASEVEKVQSTIATDFTAGSAYTASDGS